MNGKLVQLLRSIMVLGLHESVTDSGVRHAYKTGLSTIAITRTGLFSSERGLVDDFGNSINLGNSP
jgi:hypothetical protein